MGRARYGHLAFVYDRLMQDAPYDDWFRWTEAMWRVTGKTPGSLLDLACGTGRLTWKFARAGYRVTGVDLSAEMLTVAESKRMERQGEARAITWLQQDMRELLLPERVDAVVCFCDSLNYLLDEDDWRKTFRAVSQSLHSAGLFLFDIHSQYKLQRLLGDETFAWEEDGVYCVWHNRFDEQEWSVEEDLTLFVEQANGYYERFDERHRQRTFPVETVNAWLGEAGFDVKRVSGDFRRGEGVKDTDERWFFCAQKNG